MIFKIDNTIIETYPDKVLINHKIVTQQIKIVQAMELFLNSGNKIISKDDLMNELWSDMVVSDDSLFKIIQELRKIFKLNGLDKDTLVNVYGKGYKISSKITILDSYEITTNNTKAFNKRILIYPVLLFLVMIFSYNWLNKNTAIQIDSQSYNELKELGMSDSKKMMELLETKYDINKLPIEDKVKVNYLIGFAYFKQGNFSDSLKHLEQATTLAKDIDAINATADAFLMKARINVFKEKHDIMWQYLNQAEKIYTELNNQKGLLSVQLSRGRYYIGTNDFESSMKVLKDLIVKAKETNDQGVHINALKNLAQVYQLIGEDKKSEITIKKMLELALEINDGNIVSFAYGQLSIFSLANGYFVKAMKNAQLTIRYAIDQNDLNQFQQSFSSLYNILNILGHKQLAEKYLRQAIDYQNSRNSDGHLNIAELNLGILKIQNNQLDEAQTLFKNISSYSISVAEHQEAVAWLSLTKYFKKDNIAAYTLAKELYFNEMIWEKSRLVAGISLVLSANELELFAESKQVFAEITKINKENWLIENQLFLNMAIAVTSKEDELYTSYQKQQHEFAAKTSKITQNTIPEKSFITSLDKYLENVFTY